VANVNVVDLSTPPQQNVRKDMEHFPLCREI